MTRRLIVGLAITGVILMGALQPARSQDDQLPDTTNTGPVTAPPPGSGKGQVGGFLTGSGAQQSLDNATKAARPYVDNPAYKMVKKAYETNLRSTQTNYYQPKLNSWKDTLTGGSPGGASKKALTESELFKAWQDEGKPGNLKDWTEARKAAADQAKKTGDLLKSGSNAIDVAGPVATFVGTLSGGGSLLEAGAGALSDFGKYWSKKVAGGLGGAGGFAVAGPVGGAVGSVVASESTGKGWDLTIGKGTADFQQSMANVDATFRNISPKKWDEYLALQAYGRSGPPVPKPVGSPGTSPLPAGNQTPSTNEIARKAPPPVPVPNPESNAYGPRPDNWPVDEPWPPTPERIQQLIADARARMKLAEGSATPTATPAPDKPTTVTETTPSPTPEGENTPPQVAEHGSKDDFENPDGGQIGGVTSTGAGQSVPTNSPTDFDTSGFARGQAKEDANKSQKVEGDYAEATRLENALRAAEEEMRQAAAEAQRVAAQQRAAHEEAIRQQEMMAAQQRQYEAYQRWLAQKRAYDQWLAQRRAAQYSQPQQGHQNAGAIIDQPH